MAADERGGGVFEGAKEEEEEEVEEVGKEETVEKETKTKHGGKGGRRYD